MEQSPLEIKKHDFTKAMTSLKKYNDRTAVAPKINRVEEKSLKVFAHKVTGEELNGVIKSIQSHLINYKSLFTSVFEELSAVYKVFDALDKEYVAGIVGSIHVIEKVSQDNRKDIKKNQTDTKKVAECLRQSVNVLERFKDEMARLKASIEYIHHLPDIDPMWDDVGNLKKRIQIIANDNVSVVKTLEKFREENKRLGRKIMLVGVVAILSAISLALFFSLSSLAPWAP